MKKFWFVLLIIILVALLAYMGWQSRSWESPNQTPDSASEANEGQLCYIWNTEAGDRATISVDIVADSATGEFHFLPFEKDSKTGIFRGVISPRDPTTLARTIDAIWEARAEGTKVKEELRIILYGGAASPGFGEMILRKDGVYAYRDKNNLSYPINLQQADCGDSAM